jgi:hypothetical protein
MIAFHRIFACLSLATLAMQSTAQANDASTVVSVADFGALPDDGKDDTTAILNAIAASKEKGSRRLVFPKGRYDISVDYMQPSKKSLFFDNFNDFTVDGQGSTLMFTGRCSALQFRDCKNLSIRSLNIDWARPPFSQGKVVAVDGMGFDVQIDEAYPVTGYEEFEAVMDYDPVTRFPLGNMQILANSGIVSCRLIAPQRLHLEIKTSPNAPQAAHYRKTIPQLDGKLIVLRHVIYGNYGLGFVECKDVTIEDVNIYTVPGMGLHAQGVENISLRRVGIRPPVGSNRLMSSTADGQYYTHCSGLISIEDSWFEGMGDDCFNACAKYKTVTRIVTPTSIEGLVQGRTWRGPTPKAGETLEFADAKTLAVHGTAKVKSARWDQPAQIFRIELEQPLPPDVGVDDFFTITTYLPKVRINNSTFRGGAARGLLFSTRDVIVENSTIQGHAFAGMMLMAGRRSAFQGPSVENVIIRGNTFSDCGGTAIYVDASVSKPGDTNGNIVIENNTIKGKASPAFWHFRNDQPEWMYWNAALCLTSVKDVIVRDNRISGYEPALFVNYASRVSVTGNKLDAAAAFYIGAKTSEVTASDNALLGTPTLHASGNSQINFINILR